MPARAIQLALQAGYHFRTVRYCPNAVAGEFLNIGLLLFRQQEKEAAQSQAATWEGARWLEDFSALRRLDPEADIQAIRGSCQELESRLRYGAAAEKLAATMHGAIRIGDSQAVTNAEAQTPAAMLQALARLYLRASAPPAAAAAGLERALQLLRAVAVLEGREKDMVEQALASALDALRAAPAPTESADDECADGEHCGPTPRTDLSRAKS
jgi:hypothetical protein